MAAELGNDLRSRDEFLHGCIVGGELDFGCYNGIEPTFDDFPDSLEDPGRFVDEDDTEGFGVIGFETFDHEFDGSVVHVCHGETGHVEDDALGKY